MDNYDKTHYSDSDHESQNGANYNPPRSASRMESSRQQTHDSYDDDYASSENEPDKKMDRRATESPSKQITFKDQYDSDSSSEYGIHHKSKTPTFQRDNLNHRRDSDASFRSGVAYTPLPEETSLIFNEDEEGMAFPQDSDSHATDMDEYIRPPDETDYIPDNDSYVSGRDIYTPLPGDPVGMAFVRGDNEHIFDHVSDSSSHRDEDTTQKDEIPSTHSRSPKTEEINLDNRRVSPYAENQSISSRSQSQRSDLSCEYLKQDEVPKFSSYSSQDIHDGLQTSTGFQPQSHPHDDIIEGKDIDVGSRNSIGTIADNTDDRASQTAEDDDHTFITHLPLQSKRIMTPEEKLDGIREKNNFGSKSSILEKDKNPPMSSLSPSPEILVSSGKDFERRKFGSKSSITERERGSTSSLKRTPTPVEITNNEVRPKQFGSKLSLLQSERSSSSSVKRTPSSEEIPGRDGGSRTFGSKSSITERERGSTSYLKQTPTPVETTNEVRPKKVGSKSSITDRERGSTSSLKQTLTPVEATNNEVRPKPFGSRSSITEIEKGSISSLKRTPTPEETTNIVNEPTTSGSKSSIMERERDSTSSLKRTATPVEATNNEVRPKQFGSKSSLLQSERIPSSSVKRTPSPEETLERDGGSRTFGSKSSITEKERGSTSSLKRTPTPLETTNNEVRPKQFGSKSSITDIEKGSTSSLKRTPTPVETKNIVIGPTKLGSKSSITERQRDSTSSPVEKSDTNVQQRIFGSKSSLSGKGTPSPEITSNDSTLYEIRKSPQQGDINREEAILVDSKDKTDASEKGPSASFGQQSGTPGTVGVEETKQEIGSVHSSNADLQTHQEGYRDNQTAARKEDIYDDYDSYSSYSDEDNYEYLNPTEEEQK